MKVVFLNVNERWKTFSLVVLLVMLANVGIASATVVGDEPGGDLVVDADNYTITGDHQGTGAYNSITVGNGGILNIQPVDTIDGAVIDVNTTVTVTGNSSIIPKGYYTISSSPDYNGRGVTISAKDIQIDAGSKIDASGTGYASGAGPGAGGAGALWANGYTGGGGGGGYGNSGGGGGSWMGVPGGAGGSAYESQTKPLDLGSSGGNAGAGPGGRGGGAIKLIVSATLTNNGSIVAQGSPGASNIFGGSGGGSGGSILISAGTLLGNGSINASGGNGGVRGSSSSGYGNGGGGGGGRVAVYYVDKSNWLGTTLTPENTVYGGSGFQIGGAGTLFLQGNNLEVAGFSNQAKIDGSTPIKTNGKPRRQGLT